MNTYEQQVIVNDKNGIKFICTLENESDAMGGSNLNMPRLLENLSEHERRSCIRFFPESFYSLSDFEE